MHAAKHERKFDYEDPPLNPALYPDELSLVEADRIAFANGPSCLRHCDVPKLLRGEPIDESNLTHQADNYPRLRYFLEECRPTDIEEGLEWEYAELWKVVEENKISDEHLNRQWKKFRKITLAGKRATGSDVLDFGAFLCRTGQLRSYPTVLCPLSRHFCAPPRHTTRLRQQRQKHRLLRSVLLPSQGLRNQQLCKRSTQE